jgi:uncharacterized protein YkwD
MKKFLTLTVLPMLLAVIVGITVYNWASERQATPTGTSDTSSTNVIAPPDATEVENRINAYRSEKGLSQLADSSALDQAAMARAEGMCAANDWSHAKDWEVLTPYYNYAYAGENLYFGFLQKEQARIAVRDWVASPTHLENIVGNYSEIGIAVKSCPGFQNEPTAIIITNYFGVPR